MTHASLGLITSSAPGGRTRSSGLKAKGRPKTQSYKLRANGTTKAGRGKRSQV